MQAEPKQGSSSSKHAAQNDRVRSVDDDAAIETLYEMLSSGRSLSEVLVTAKRLKSGVDGRPVTQIECAEDEARSAPPQWKTSRVKERVEPRFSDPSGALGGDTTIDPAQPPAGLKVQAAPKSARYERGLAKRLSQLAAAALLWLIPAISLVTVGTAIKGLLDADLTRTVAEVTALLKAIPGVVHLERDLPPPAATSETSRVEPEVTQDRAETVRPMEQGVTGSPAAPAAKAGATAPASIQDRGSLDTGTSKGSSEAENSTPIPPTAETILNASEAAPAQIESVRTVAQVATESPTDAVAEAATARQTSFQRGGLPSVVKGTRTHASVYTAQPRSAKKRHTRVQRRMNFLICPHFGHCLTPPIE